MKALINGKAFSAADIIILIAGVEVASANSISITENANKANNYGMSRRPVSRGRGNEEIESSVGLSYKDVQKLRSLSPSGKLTDIPAFDLLVILDNGQDLARVRARAAEFNSDGMEASSGDTNITREYDLIVGAVDYR